MKLYSNFVASHPYIMIAIITSLSLSCLMVSIWTEKIPDFSDPQAGFETRGTPLSFRLTTWENLLKATKLSGPVIMNPADAYVLKPTVSPTFAIRSNDLVPTVSKAFASPRTALLKSKVRKKGKPLKAWSDAALADSDIGKISTWVPEKNASNKLGATDRLVETLEREEWASLRQTEISHEQNDDENDFKNIEDGDHQTHNEDDHDHSHLSPDGFFCEGSLGSYSHLVVTSRKDNQSLLSLQSLHDLCQLEDRLMAESLMTGLCQTVKDHQCCPPWSLANYVAMLNNRISCMQITEEDVSSTRDLLSKCHANFIKYQLEPGCEGTKACANVSQICRNHDAVYNILQYLIDAEFEPSKCYVKASMVFLPIARSSAVLPYLNGLSSSHMTRDVVTVSAVDFGVKGALFDEYLVKDTILMGGAAFFILLCLWCYTGSLFLTLSSITAVFMSLIIAYFLYTFVFNIRFFPFMNLLGVVVAIGTGTDDAFIYCKLWRCVKQESGGAPTVSLVSSSLKSSAISMAVTSLTTAAALFSNCVSPITAINCFSIFAGMAVLVNYCLMISWLPACVVVSEHWCLPPPLPLQWRPALNQKFRAIKKYSNQIRVHVDRYLTLSILRLRWFWLISLGGIAIGAAIIVLHYPRLRLPDSKTFQLFQSHHPVEQYDLFYRNKFWFERQGKGDAWDEPYGRLPLRFIWGVLPADDGNYLDPSSRGNLEFDTTFDVAAQESQTWLLKFCQELRLQPFYNPTLGPLHPNCFIESFKSWMLRRCKNSARNEDFAPCCETSSFPYSRRVFSRCLPLAVNALHQTPSSIFQLGTAGPRFARANKNEVKAVVIEYESNRTYSNSYHDMAEFYKTVETWFHSQMAMAPAGLKKGWFTSDLGFYDLQMALSSGTIAAIALSIGVALIVVFLTTLNALVSIFTVLTISAIIFVTVAILVLLGWKLNILESVAVTTAIGLSVDFSLHYGVHYRLSEEDKREPAVVHALTRMTGPTAMGALTTGASGAFMLLSTVLPYIQIGILLVVLTIVSWVYSTVFLMSLLVVFGPENGCGQFSRPRPQEWCRGPPSDKPPVVGLWSESTLSTSSGPVEVHELEALTRGPRRNRKPRAQSPALPEDLDADSVCQMPN